MEHGSSWETSPAVDRSPFARDSEAALCQQLMGERAHGLDDTLRPAPQPPRPRA